jgi:hypothetical protein
MNDAYSKNEYLDLPVDPEEAFAILQQQKYKELEVIWESRPNSEEYSYTFYDERRSIGSKRQKSMGCTSFLE